MDRARNLDRLNDAQEAWDMIVIGGGATGLGVAVDAASRGYRTLLLEQHDFAKGTSSRSTKLVHGGVRYLKQGNIGLVMDALKERGRLCLNAPHLVHHMSFIVPIYTWWEGPFYGVGMRIYDRMAGELGLRPSKSLSLEETRRRLPTIEPEGLRGGVIYYDGQFDDARLAISLARTVDDLDGCALNYMKVVGLIKENGVVTGVQARDEEGGKEYEIRSRVVVNATGVYTDTIRKLDDAATPSVIVASQGSHIVLPRTFQPGDSAVMIPHTEDGRVLFAVPWHGHVVVGTTDVARAETPLEPVRLDEELEFLMTHAAKYLTRNPAPSDVLSVFSGLRALVKEGEGAASTAAMSRDHTILIAQSGLITITGGKWTTYRKMAEDTVDQAETLAGWAERPCRTATLPVHGATEDVPAAAHLQVYGSDVPAVMQLAGELADGRSLLHPDLPYWRAEVTWAVRHEMARTVEDVLARRTRALFLNARAAIAMAPAVAALMGEVLKWDERRRAREVEAFTTMAQGYLFERTP